ncbi:unnamed protein product [Blepharisma stoltei]|uniref:BZIP domain-containing protein n=1 Tax=Blepharisma stoltei TaxID=1481888 RepID=A0AAU9J104_9CILI|nr:unnamed protein product [Blepharisma stoltei]
MEDINFDTVFDSVLDQYLNPDLDQASTNVSPIENEDPYFNLDPIPTDNSQDIFLSEKDPKIFSSSLLLQNFDNSDYIRSEICSLCGKNLVKSEDGTCKIPKKRKRLDATPSCASTKVCLDCKKLDIKDLNSYKNASKTSKMVIKRENAKKAFLQKKSEELQKLEEEEKIILENSKNLPIEEQKRLKQKMRNRVSAQRSRDKKKELLTQLIEENENLKSKNNELKRRLIEAENENAHLKKQLSHEYIGDSGSMPKTAKYLSLGFIAAISVIMIVSTSQPQMQGTELKALPSRKLIEVPAIRQKGEVKIIDEVSIFPDKDKYLPISELNEYRQNRMDMYENVPSFRSFEGANDPCARNMINQVRDGKFTTLFCPSIQAFWDQSQESPNLQFIQIVTPLESMSGLAPATPIDPSQDYMLEIICKVTDVKVMPAISATIDP